MHEATGKLDSLYALLASDRLKAANNGVSVHRARSEDDLLSDNSAGSGVGSAIG
jgi:hypothetical protein